MKKNIAVHLQKFVDPIRPFNIWPVPALTTNVLQNLQRPEPWSKWTWDTWDSWDSWDSWDGMPPEVMPSHEESELNV